MNTKQKFAPLRGDMNKADYRAFCARIDSDEVFRVEQEEALSTAFANGEQVEVTAEAAGDIADQFNSEPTLDQMVQALIPDADRAPEDRTIPTAAQLEREEKEAGESRGFLSPSAADGTNNVTHIVSEILTEAQSKVADANRDTVSKALDVAERSAKGTTETIFSVLRQTDTGHDADTILRRLESEWMNERKVAKCPDSWRSIKSKLLKPYKELPGLIEKAVVGAKAYQLANSFDAAAIAAHLAAVRLDGTTPSERVHPRAYQPDQASGFLAGVAGLRKAITAGQSAEQKAAKKTSGATGSGLQSGSYSLADMPEWAKTAISRVAGAARKAVADGVDQEKIVNILGNAESLLNQQINKSAKAREALDLKVEDQPQVAAVAANA